MPAKLLKLELVLLQEAEKIGDSFKMLRGLELTIEQLRECKEDAGGVAFVLLLLAPCSVRAAGNTQRK